ncbi:MAG: hypothetical protein E7313_06475 [Clostridiales bacterium]|nr:hypothetical protein [Clostridiales bacterium]
MNFNYFSITFWFDIFENHKDLLEIFQKEFSEEFNNINIMQYTDNLVAPIITSINNEKRTNFSFSQINFQYNMDNVDIHDFANFNNACLKFYDILTSNNILIKHSAILVNGELIDENALETISKKFLKDNISDDDFVDVSLKIGKKHEELFYKIVSVLNKKQLKLPKKTDDKGRFVPIPLISWNETQIENEIIEISHEINDKYSFDNTKDYHTTEFYLNKMLYILGEDIKEDINNLF